MADLRKRFEQHGFDSNGNDYDMKSFTDILKNLPEFSKEISKYSKIQQESNKIAKEQIALDKKLEKEKFYKELPDKIGKAIANTPNRMKQGANAIGEGVYEAAKTVGEGALSKATTATQSGINSFLAMSGPVGYALAASLNLGRGITNTIGSFGRGAGGSLGKLFTSSREGNNTSNTGESGALAIKKNSFEALPTVIRLKTWLTYQAKNDATLKKYYNSAFKRHKEQENFEKEQSKGMKAQKEILKKMENSTATAALSTKALIGLTLVAGVAILGLVSWVKTHPLKVQWWPFGKDDKTPANTSSSVPTTSPSVPRVGTPNITSTYGTRPPVVDSNGKVVSQGGNHYGVDVAGTLGNPITTVVPGKAYARAQFSTGFEEYKEDKKDTRQYTGYGIFVDVHVSPIAAEKMGYAGKQVIVRYAHLLKSAIKSQGQSVSIGDIIGYVGNTGGSSGPHTHYEVLVNDTVVGTLGKQWAFNDSTNSWERWNTVDPMKTTAFIGSTKTNIIGAAVRHAQTGISSSGNSVNMGYLLNHTSDNIKINSNPSGVTTGSAASLSLVGKNNTLMGSNNVSFRNSNQIESTPQNNGYVGTLPNLTNKIQEKNNPTVLNFDTSNENLQIIKNSPKQVSTNK